MLQLQARARNMEKGDTRRVDTSPSVSLDVVLCYLLFSPTINVEVAECTKVRDDPVKVSVDVPFNAPTGGPI